MEDKICIECGKKHNRWTSKYQRHSYFCSTSCYKKNWRRNKKEISYRRCKQCNKEFILTRSDKLFCSNSCGRKHYRINNSERENINSKKWRLDNPDKVKISKRRDHLKRKYGMSLEEFEDLSKKQNRKCKICGRYMNKIDIDHNHKTGEIRGLLCNSCNRGIGHFKENTLSLIKTIKYLRGEL